MTSAQDRYLTGDFDYVAVGHPVAKALDSRLTGHSANGCITVAVSVGSKTQTQEFRK